MNVSAATGKPLEATTNAIAKAYDGNFGALKKLGIPLSENIIKSKDFNKVAKEISRTFGGSLDASLETTQGKLKLMTARWEDMKEQIGYVLLDGLQPLMDWASGPEGQQFMDDFMNAFKDAALAIAKALPVVLEMVKNIGKAASGMGLDFSTFASPELLAAGAAFMAFPGPPQLKALAAVAAYFGAKDAMKTSADRKAEAAGINANAVKVGGFYDGGGATCIGNFGMSYRNQAQQDAAVAAAKRANAIAAASHTTINVTSLDPATAAKLVSQSLNKASRLGINTAAIGTGS